MARDRPRPYHRKRIGCRNRFPNKARGPTCSTSIISGADPQGVSISSPAFRTNQQIWHGDASYFFRSVGFEHATSCIGAFMLRSSFVTDKIITLFETPSSGASNVRIAWWMMEAGMSSRKFYFVSAPILINKMNSHHFDHARTWGENAKRQAKPYHYDWTIGFLKHLQYYVDSGQMTYKQIANCG